MTAINVSSTFQTIAPKTETVVRTETPAPVADRPNYVAIYSSTIFAISMFFLFGVGVPAAMAYGNAAGWGMGAFCAFWGGPSFGVMAGSARVSAWYEKNNVHF